MRIIHLFVPWLYTQVHLRITVTFFCNSLEIESRVHKQKQRQKHKNKQSSAVVAKSITASVRCAVVCSFLGDKDLECSTMFLSVTHVMITQQQHITAATLRITEQGKRVPVCEKSDRHIALTRKSAAGENCTKTKQRPAFI